MNAPEHLLASLPAAADGHRMDRRGFLTFAAKGLGVAFALPLVGRSASVLAAAPTSEQLASSYIRIGSDGSITLMFGGAEMGQGAMSGLAQILAEELMVDWNQVRVQQSLVDPVVTYFTGGSSAVAGRYARLRNAGAAAREMLIAAAMQRQGDANRDNYSAASAVVRHSSGATWAYKDLAAAAATLPAPADLRLTNPTALRLIGKRVPRVDLPSKVDGSAKYGIDTWSADMVFGVIKHCPTFGGTLAATPATPYGAIAVVPCKASDTRGKVVAGTVNAVAVVAANTWKAMQLAKSLSVSWKLPTTTADVDSTAIAATAQTLLASGAALVSEPAPPAGYTPASYAPVVEPVVAGWLGTPNVNANYTLPYLAHATMEPLACTVKFTFNGTTPIACEIWAPTQGASSVPGLVTALAPTVPASAVTVRTTLLGGGLGRKFELDYVYQAIQVALAVKRPVKLTWTREEDFGHDQYRPCAAVNVKARLSAGRIAAWSYRNVSQSLLGARGWLGPGAVDSQAVEGAVHLPYDPPSAGPRLVEWVPLTATVPVGFWRSVGASINAFVVESTMDELAAQAGIDPFQFRYNHLTSDAAQRFRAVLWALDIMSSSWRGSVVAGHAWGVAIAESFGTIVAQIAEVSQPVAGALTIHRIDCAIDCGTVINPDSVEAQMQGGILHALNATLWGQSTFTAGKANQLNFNRYRVMRVNEMPPVRVQIVASTSAPSGVGEPGVPPLAPALANAHARLAGKTRIRSLPFFPNALMGGL